MKENNFGGTFRIINDESFRTPFRPSPPLPLGQSDDIFGQKLLKQTGTNADMDNMDTHANTKYMIADETETIFYGPFNTTIEASQWALGQNWGIQGRVLRLNHAPKERTARFEVGDHIEYSHHQKNGTVTVHTGELTSAKFFADPCRGERRWDLGLGRECYFEYDENNDQETCIVINDHDEKPAYPKL